MSEGSADDLGETPRPIQRMLDHFGFAENPFGEAVDEKVFSGVGNRSSVASEIAELFRSAPAGCLLVAPAGGGKQTLAGHIVEQLGAGWCVAWVDGREIQDPFDLIGELFGQLGLDEESEGIEVEGSSPIAGLVARRFVGGENCLLVLEHAEQLAPEAQQWLRSQGRQEGQPEVGLRQLWLAESADSIEPADDGHQWTAITLEPLSDAEALEYLHDRFAAAGRSRRVPIEKHDLAWLNHVAGGWPGSINRVARDYLVQRAKVLIERQPTGRLRLPAGLLYALVGVAVAVGTAVVTVRYLSTLPDTDTAGTTSSTTSSDGPEPDLDRVEPDLVRDEPDAGSQPSIADSGSATESTGGDGEVALAAEEASTDGDTATGDPEPVQSGDNWAAVDWAAVDAEPAPSAGDTAAADAESAPLDAGAVDPEPTLSGDAGAGREDAVATTTVYTVQIAGGRDRGNVAALGNELGARLDTEVARLTLDGRPWYVLISGRHDSIPQARAAIADLPAEVRSRSPWPRPLSELEVLESTASGGRSSRDVPDPGAVTAGQDDGDVAAPRAPYTLQLVGVRDRGSLEALVSELDTPERYEILSTTLEGRPWYVLTHGRYETSEAARSAIEQLPEELQRYAPWPRPLSELQ